MRDTTRIFAPVLIKLIFNKDIGKIYGAQALGRDGVDKRMDVIATAIKANLTVLDLPDLELSYAPPYSSAKRPCKHGRVCGK